MIAARFGIPVTNTSRTLLDLALTVTPRGLQRAFDEADRLELLDREELHGMCVDAARRPGVDRVRRLLGQAKAPLAETRSPLESRFLQFCRDRGLPIPAVNVPVGGYEVACLWPEARLVAELDSWAHHGGRDSFEADRRRDARIQRLGVRVIRVTDLAMARTPDDLDREIRGLLGLPLVGLRPSRV